MRTIAHISDIHFGATDPRAVDALRRDLLAHRHDLLVVSGDFTQRARSGQFREAMAFLRDIPGPRLAVPGNHDVPLWNAARRFSKPLGRYKKFVDADLLPTFDDGRLLVMGLNTARPLSLSVKGFWKDGRVSRRQLLHVRRVFGRADDRFKVVVTHHPFLPPPAAPASGVALEFDGPRDGAFRRRIVHKATRALDVLEEVGVELLLAGHLHLNYSGDVRLHHERTARSILSVQAGTATSHRTRGVPNAYNRIEVQTPADDGVPAERVTVRVRQCEADRFEPGAVATFEKRDAGWARVES